MQILDHYTYQWGWGTRKNAEERTVELGWGRYKIICINLARGSVLLYSAKEVWHLVDILFLQSLPVFCRERRDL